MTFFNAGGAGGDGSGGIYVLIALILSPFVVGLAFRLFDRRGGDDQPADRSPLTRRRWRIRTGIAVASGTEAFIGHALQLWELMVPFALLCACVAPLRSPSSAVPPGR